MEEYFESNNQNQQSEFPHVKEIEPNNEAKQIDMNEGEIKNLYVSLQFNSLKVTNWNDEQGDF